MKIFSLVHNYWDYCENWENSLGYFSNEDLADYLKLELDKEYYGNDRHSFWVEEIVIDNSEMDQYLPILNKILEKLK